MRFSWVDHLLGIATIFIVAGLIFFNLFKKSPPAPVPIPTPTYSFSISQPDLPDSVWKQIEEEYGVPRKVISAILQVESGFGRNQGRYSAWSYFQKKRDQEDLAALKQIAAELGIEPRGIRGSHKGALGIPQFLPRNWIKFGVDGDSDGKIDLFQSMPDAVFSVANYLEKHGYRKNPDTAIRAYIGPGPGGRSYVRAVKRLAGL